MSDIQDVMDVTFEELSAKQQLQLKEATEQFQQKCLMLFSKNRSGVPFLKSDMPRVLMPGELIPQLLLRNKKFLAWYRKRWKT
jgi:hypothetical protein